VGARYILLFPPSFFFPFLSFPFLFFRMGERMDVIVCACGAGVVLYSRLPFISVMSWRRSYDSSSSMIGYLAWVLFIFVE